MKTIISNVQTVIKNLPNLVFNYSDSYYNKSDGPMWSGKTPAILKESWSAQLRNKTIIGVKVIPLDQSQRVYLYKTDNAVVGTQKGSMTLLSYFDTKTEDLGKPAIYYLNEPISLSSGYMVISGPSSAGNLYISRYNLWPEEMADNNIYGCVNDVITENNYVLQIDFILGDE